MSEIEITSQLIVCPWCFGAVIIETEEEIFTCPNCRREFSADDLEFTENQEK